MTNTLVIYEGKYGIARSTAEVLGYIIGNTKVFAVQEAPESIQDYQNIVFTFSFYGHETLKLTKPYIEKLKGILRSKQIAVVGVGLTRKDLADYIKPLRAYLPVKEERIYFIEGELCLKKLSAEDYRVLQDFTQKVKMPLADTGIWQLKEAVQMGAELYEAFKTVEKEMPKDMLKEEIKAFIKEHNMLALSTGKDSYVRCSPVEYVYDEEKFYIITEGGSKFRGLLQNSQVSAGIYEPYKGMNQLAGLQITGRAVIIPLSSKRYNEVMAVRGVKEEVINRLPVNLYMIEIKPVRFEILSSNFVKKGYDAGQIYICQEEIVAD